MTHDQTTSETALGLIREGWDHLRRQRPLAAWASWQRALRLDPENAAARGALETWETAAELPAAARAVYRFQTPTDPDRRGRWDARLRGRGLEDLDAAAAAFASLAVEDPDDADARLNLALCHAWLGRNAEAVACLDRVVAGLAPSNPDRAADSWAVAEVLRLGAGAEALADDYRYAWVVDWPGGDGPPGGLLAAWPNLVPVALPDDPGRGTPPLDAVAVFEWLDRPPPPAGSGTPRGELPPRVLASVVSTPRVLRLSSPDPSGFAVLDEPAFAAVRDALATARREKTPLALAWADAAVGAFRFPPGLDEAARGALARAAVEHYFENLWIHRPRQALGGLAPLGAAVASAAGDAIARAWLSGVVRFREQLGSRPTHAAIYQGYPFDRLRRRLGLLPAVEGAVDPDDLSCASGEELDAIDPASLDARRLADAFASAAPLRSDPRTARYAAELARRAPLALAGLDPSAVFAPLVREALKTGDPELALDWLRRAGPVVDARHARTFAVWSAEIHARTARPDRALAIYEDLLGRPDAGAALALDGAETLLDNGYPGQAVPLLLEAQAQARASGDHATLHAAEQLLRRVGRPRP